MVPHEGWRVAIGQLTVPARLRMPHSHAFCQPLITLHTRGDVYGVTP